MSTINAATRPPACPGRNVAGAANHGAVHPSAVRLNLPRLGLYDQSDQTTNSHSNSNSLSKPMKFELPQGLYMKAEAKDEESDDYRQNLNQTMNLRASTLPSTLPSMNVSMNMNQTMPLMDSEISLTVPMSRKNAAIITSTRLKRLKTLSSAKEEQLTGNQVVEKKRIIRLEKNRRAAAMSRKKKKVYIRDLEENSKLMERHLAILKMENDHLRALLSANMQQQAQQAQQMMAAQHAQSQQAQQGMVGRANSTPAPAPTTNPTSNPTQLIGLQAPPIMPPNPAKRRRLNDGSASTTASTTAATSLNTSMDELAIDATSESVEKQEMDAMPPPPPPPPHSHALNPMMHPMAGHAIHGMLNQSMPNLQRMRMMPNMFHGHPQQMPQQMGQMPMHQSHPQMHNMNQMNPMIMAQMNANGAHPMPPPPQTMAQPQIQPQIQIQIPAQHSQQPKVEAKFDLKIEAMSEQKAESPDNSKLLPMPLPPSVLGTVSDSDDFDNEDFGVLPFLDESFIGETGDDGGFVI